MGRNILWMRIGIAFLVLVSFSLVWMGCSLIQKESRGEPLKGNDVSIGN